MNTSTNTSTSKPVVNVMLDLETTATSTDAGILSIGAACFHPHPVGVVTSHYYGKASLLSLEEADFAICSDTMSWWDKQDPAVRAEAFSGTQTIDCLLQSFQEYLRTVGSAGEIHLWGNGSDFDNVILLNALDECGLEAPWKFRNNRCYRTLKNLFPAITAAPFTGDKHNALADATFQAKHASKILHHIDALSLALEFKSTSTEDTQV